MRSLDTLRPALLALLLLAAPLQAQEHYAFGFSPRTGDAGVDVRLGDFNAFAARDRDGFIDEIVDSYGAPRHLVREYLIDRGWPPGDIYYGCALAHHTGRPCLEVLHLYEHDRGQGWGVIARRLGIKPGSSEFHALKDGVGRSHGKWQHGRADDGGPPEQHGHDSGQGRPADRDKKGPPEQHGRGAGKEPPADRGKGPPHG